MHCIARLLLSSLAHSNYKFKILIRKQQKKKHITKQQQQQQQQKTEAETEYVFYWLPSYR